MGIEGVSMDNLDRQEMIYQQLKKNGFRITPQRRLLIGIILEHECSSCKEIYYMALKEDPTVGIATVYRIIKTLEESGLINRKNLYNITYEGMQLPKNNQFILVNEEDGSVKEIRKGGWFTQLQKELKLSGLIDDQQITIVVKASPTHSKEGEIDDQLYYSCQCDNHSCSHNQKRTSAS